MKKTLLLVIFLMLAIVTIKATPPYYATTLLQRPLAGVWANSGDTLSFTLTGTNTAGTGTNSVPIFIDVNEGTIFTSPSIASNTASWTISGTLIPVSTNLLVTIQFTSGDTNHSLAGASFVLTNFNASSNTFYLWTACDLCGSPVLVSSSFASPNIPLYDAYGQATAATNTPILTRFSTNVLTGLAGGGSTVANSPTGLVATLPNSLAVPIIGTNLTVTFSTNSGVVSMTISGLTTSQLTAMLLPLSLNLNTNSGINLTNAGSRALSMGWTNGNAYVGVTGTNNANQLQLGISSGGTSGNGSVATGRVLLLNLNGPFLQFTAATSGNAGSPLIALASISSSAASGTFSDFGVTPAYNQSGTAGGEDFVISRTNITVGTGPQYLCVGRVTTNGSASNKWTVDIGGNETANTISLVATNAGPAFTPGSTAPRVFFPVTNAGTVYYIPGY